MFDQLVKRSNSVWIYTTGRFAEERLAFLCDLSKGGRSRLTLRNVNRLLLVMAEPVNVPQRMPIPETHAVMARHAEAAAEKLPSLKAKRITRIQFATRLPPTCFAQALISTP